MKIVEIIPQLSSGGAERFTVDLCNELSIDNDVTLIVLHSIENNGFYASEISPKVKLISMNKRMGADISLPFRLRQEIKKIAPDLVHTHLVGIVYSILSIMTMRSIKFFHTVHNDAEKEAGGVISTLVRRICFKSNRVTPVTISIESQRSFVNFYGINATLIANGRNIPTNIELSDSVLSEFKQYRKTSKTKVLVILARINPVKRQPLLAKIASRLTAEGYDFTLLMIGSTRQTNLIKEIESYNCPNIKILGEKQNPLEYLKLADAYCLCSSYEGMPISLIEALGVGVVPICTPVGGIVDVISDGKNGFLSSDISEESYYNSLKHFLDLSTKEIQNIKIETLKSYEPYSMTECSKRYVHFFISRI